MAWGGLGGRRAEPSVICRWRADSREVSYLSVGIPDGDSGNVQDLFLLYDCFLPFSNY